MIQYAKITFLVCSIVGLISSFAHASFKVPDYVFTVSELSTIPKKARENKTFTFVYSNKNTNCGLAASASIDLFEGLKGHSIVVYVESKKDWKELPSVVQNGLNSSEAGRYIPKTVVVNSEQDNIISIIPYAEKGERRKMIQQAQSLIAKQ